MDLSPTDMELEAIHSAYVNKLHGNINLEQFQTWVLGKVDEYVAMGQRVKIGSFLCGNLELQICFQMPSPFILLRWLFHNILFLPQTLPSPPWYVILAAKAEAPRSTCSSYTTTSTKFKHPLLYVLLSSWTMVNRVGWAAFLPDKVNPSTPCSGS